MSPLEHKISKALIFFVLAGGALLTIFIVGLTTVISELISAIF